MNNKTFTKKEVAEIIANGLEKQRFADWYNNGNFEVFITDSMGGVTKETVLSDIERIFHL